MPVKEERTAVPGPPKEDERGEPVEGPCASSSPDTLSYPHARGCAHMHARTNFFFWRRALMRACSLGSGRRTDVYIYKCDSEDHVAAHRFRPLSVSAPIGLGPYRFRPLSV